MKKIIHACSSALVRPNGIVRYMNNVMEFQQEAGCEVYFVSDAKPTEHIVAFNIVAKNEVSAYTPNQHPTEPHVWLQVDNNVVDDLEQSLRSVGNVDKVFCHDLMSFLAAKRVFEHGIFIQHESDVLTGLRLSYISDEWYEQQVEIVKTERAWHIGMLLYSEHIIPANGVLTPFIFTPQTPHKSLKSRDLLFIGEPSERKGAPQFMDMVRKLKVKASVISQEYSDIFEGAQHFSYLQTDKDKMYALMREHKVAYIPSMNETLGFGILECLQFMPVILDSQYGYTKNLTAFGAEALPLDKIQAELARKIMFWSANYTPTKLIHHCAKNREQWRDLTFKTIVR
jgi:hypothetical protein